MFGRDIPILTLSLVIPEVSKDHSVWAGSLTLTLSLVIPDVTKDHSGRAGNCAALLVSDTVEEDDTDEAGW